MEEFVSDGSSALVWWILVPAFAAVGLYLLWFARRRGRMLATFAEAHGHRPAPERTEEVQRTLDGAFALEEKGLVRSFGQLASVVEAGPILVFRAVELLDLSPHGQSQSTHFSRIAAFFEVKEHLDAFFLLDRSGQVRPLLPGGSAPASEVAALARRLASEGGARHALSITLARGHGLVYFEPLVTGGEKPRDLESLLAIAQGMREELARDG